jgi:hypothetical protein
MTVPACDADNRDGAGFCGECAAPLVKPVVCTNCGAIVVADFIGPTVRRNPRIARKIVGLCARTVPERRTRTPVGASSKGVDQGVGWPPSR